MLSDAHQNYKKNIKSALAGGIDERIEILNKKENRLKKWPDYKRAVPSSWLRCELFGISLRPREKIEKVIKNKYVEIYYSGWTLNQTDLTVWMELLEKSAGQSRWNAIFDEEQLLIDLGKDVTEFSRCEIENCMRRFVESNIKIMVKKNCFTGALMGEATRNQFGTWSVNFNEQIIRLLNFDNLTFLNPQIRRKLNKRQLALWLTAFYSSHKNPYPMKIETIKDLVGSKSSVFKFNQNLKRALAAITVADVHFYWTIEKKLLVVKKNRL